MSLRQASSNIATEARAGRNQFAPFFNTRALRVFTLLSVIANCVIVVTGGAVRVTASGLGCPTWPSCTDDSLTPVAEYSWHGAVEFGNRMLTFVVVVVAIGTLVLAVAQRTERRLALLAFLGIPAQAVLGGITVLTGLNPYSVASHFLLSMVLIALTMVLHRRVRLATGAAPPVPAAVPGPVGLLARVTVGVTALVLVIGTVVTGSGPHAGDEGARHRMGFSPAAVSQLHADLVMVLIGLAIGLAVALRLTHAPRGAVKAGWWLLAAIAAQGVVGYTQYFLGVPAALVVVHMAGACTVWVAALAVPLQLTGRRRRPDPAPAPAVAATTDARPLSPTAP